jgi:uncharacterized membrane protein YphA (DoxX/SURF4 family)
MTRNPSHPSSSYLVAVVARLLLAGVFVSAAINKILDPLAFETAILSYRVVGETWAGWTALVLPWVEITAGFGILVRPIRRASGCIVSLLLLTFIALHLSAWARGLDISCGCFGKTDVEVAYHWLVARNLALLAAALWATYLGFRNFDARLSSKAL